MSFHPIITEYCRLALVPDDMPLYAPEEIPNVRFHFKNEHGIIHVPYKVTGISRNGVNTLKIAASVRPHLERQITRDDFIAKYGRCEIANEHGQVIDKGVKKELESVLLNSLPGRTNVSYRTHGIGNNRKVVNYILLGVTNGINFRTWTHDKEFFDHLAEAEKRNLSELHGICSAFGRKAYCTLTHDFFDLNRFTTESWSEFVTKQVYYCFPFLRECALFGELEFHQA